MRNLRFSLALFGRISLPSLLAFQTLTALAGPTHLNVPDSAMITLVADGRHPSSRCEARYAFEQIALNGERASEAFEVPKGLRLVITDIVWNSDGERLNLVPGEVRRPPTVSLRFSLIVAPPSGSPKEVFESAPMYVGLEPIFSNLHGNGERLISGIRIDELTQLCASTESEARTRDGEVLRWLHALKSAYIYGYLTPID